jgi:hypothetical protein
MVAQLLEALVTAHGEEAVVKALHVVKEHLVTGGESLLNFIGDGHEDNPAHASLLEAWNLTHGNRKSSYGDVRVAFARYAKIWSGLLGAKLTSDLTASDVALLMTALKLAREMNKQQSDNVTDAHGYLILHDEIKAAQ